MKLVFFAFLVMASSFGKELRPSCDFTCQFTNERGRPVNGRVSVTPRPGIEANNEFFQEALEQVTVGCEDRGGKILNARSTIRSCLSRDFSPYDLTCEFTCLANSTSFYSFGVTGKGRTGQLAYENAVRKCAKVHGEVATTQSEINRCNKKITKELKR